MPLSIFYLNHIIMLIIKIHIKLFLFHMLKLEQRVIPPVKGNNSFKEPCDHFKMFISNMLEIQGIAHQQDHLKNHLAS